MHDCELQAHLNDLADMLECRLDQAPDMPGMMYVEFGYVEGPSLHSRARYPDSEACYLTCLHELGHFAHGHTQGRPPMGHLQHYFDNGVLRSEAEAWTWALDHSLIACPSKAARDFMWYTCLNSYFSASKLERGDQCQLWNGNRHHVMFAWDKPDDLFWQVQRRMGA